MDGIEDGGKIRFAGLWSEHEDSGYSSIKYYSNYRNREDDFKINYKKRATAGSLLYSLYILSYYCFTQLIPFKLGYWGCVPAVIHA